MAGSLTDVAGFRVGHWTDARGATGCTVVLCPPGSVGGASLRGFASGTRGAETLGPLHTTPHVDAILLSGGSAFGLDAARGVMRFLEERGRGFRVGPAVVPIVAAAILFDLGAGDPKARPGPDDGYAACEAASEGAVAEGSVGAGTGCTVGKLHGIACATKSGLGSAGVASDRGLAVGVAVAVNAFGDVVDPSTGAILAGLRDAPDSSRFSDMAARIAAGEPRSAPLRANTTIAAVATNARVDKPGACRLADQVHDAFARDTARPYGIRRRRCFRRRKRIRRRRSAQAPEPRHGSHGRGNRARRARGDVSRRHPGLTRSSASLAAPRRREGSRRGAATLQETGQPPGRRSASVAGRRR